MPLNYIIGFCLALNVDLGIKCLAMKVRGKTGRPKKKLVLVSGDADRIVEMLSDEELSGTERLKLESLLAMATGECTFASLATENSAALGQLNGKDVLQSVEFTSELSRRSQPLASFLWRNLSKRT